MPSVKSRRELYSEATRAALIDTATRLFAERGFTRTSLEDIAAETRVTRGAVYHHFAGKPALFEAVLEAQETEALGLAAEAAAGVTDPWEAATAALDAFLDRCLDPTYNQIVWHEGPIALGLAHWKECEERYAFGLIEKMLRGLMEAGVIATVPLDIATRLAFSLLGAAGGAIADAEAADRPRVKDACGDLIRSMITGLRPQ